MRTHAAFLALCPVFLPGALALAQTHQVARPENVVRAVGVYEYTGEEAKATASRFIPVSLYINGKLEDAGAYLARPVPFALQTGTIFAIRQAGEDQGTLELAYARHVTAPATGSYDEGWMAVGAFKTLPKPVLTASARKGGPLPQIEVSGGKGPHFNTKPDPAVAAPAKPVDRSGAASGGTTVSAQDDPDRPTMRRKTDDAPADASADDSKDVDRPTLRKRTPEQTKKDTKVKQLASVKAVGDLNDDPDRPNLHRGKPVGRLEEEDLPPLQGIPPGMQQRVAVSDARNRPEHDFGRAFESEAERSEVLAAMRTLARAQLAGYDAGPPVSTRPVAAGKVVGKAAKRPIGGAPAEAPFEQEDLRGYTLSYGGAATFEFQASSPGADGAVRYVTVVAQRDPLGAIKLALARVTDAQHLDRTPWFRLVDVVDAEASNRASLLFELRGQTTRQFALYRVIGAQAEQTFVTYPAE